MNVAIFTLPFAHGDTWWSHKLQNQELASLIRLTFGIASCSSMINRSKRSSTTMRSISKPAWDFNPSHWDDNIPPYTNIMRSWCLCYVISLGQGTHRVTGFWSFESTAAFLYQTEYQSWCFRCDGVSYVFGICSLTNSVMQAFEYVQITSLVLFLSFLRSQLLQSYWRRSRWKQAIWRF